MGGLSGGGWRGDVVWTSTSEKFRAWPRFSSGPGQGGFSLIELLLGLSLALCLALGVAPIWISFQSLGAREGDETIWTLQARLAGARFERDLRLAGLRYCPFATAATVLQATTSQVVLVVTASDSTAPIVVEWELVGGSLMRRWGPCPAACPSTFSHSIYSDSKTMVEDVDTARSIFSFQVAGRAATAPVAAGDLPLVDVIAIAVAPLRDQATAGGIVTAHGRVGR
jgi:type II secretory pathway component PulJ